jgi:protein-tyrosine phosphatase
MAVIDLHSHILARVDHGSESTEMSVSQLALMKEMVTDIAVATSHFYPNAHTIEDFERRVSGAIERLRSVSPANMPKLCLGAEVLYCKNMANMAGIERLCIRGTRVMLVEMPLEPLGSHHVEAVEELIFAGFTVVLAHIDRYLKHSESVIDEMLELGAYAQINAEAFAHFGERRRAMRYIKETDRVVALGSDLHGNSSKYYKKFVELRNILGDSFDTIMNRSASLLENAEYVEI